MEPTEAPEQTAVDLLLRGLAERKREEVRRDFLAFLWAYHRHHGTPLPEWIKERESPH